MFEPIRLQSKASKYKKGLTHVKNTVTRNQKYTVQSQKPKRRKHKYNTKENHQKTKGQIKYKINRKTGFKMAINTHISIIT